ncbi:SH3 domain-containing protein [Butyrivibrio sp. FCS014]|uniref:SH3 domain-containing protein n=1 Tax=Butyrivibrio sp. FCS014 TaxID=1408304 RepID=UPI0004676FE4|nr:SH3 domain-containing protein [Butyrivibrio sp. FCS014]
MADKIMNFEDYKKRESGQEEASEKIEKETAPKEESVKKPGDETLTALDIKIEDPENFFNEEEREEYIHQRQKEKKREEAPAAKRSEDLRREEPVREERKEGPPRREEARYEEREEEYEEDYDEEDYDEEDYDDEDEGGINMDLVVRVASIITGVIILAFIIFALKVKVFDRYFAKDPDEVQTEVSSLTLPEGFVEKNDTVTVTGASLLNLRSGPDTSSSVVGLVPEGDILKRIAVNNEGTWAILEVDGQQVYASMKYLKEN